MSKGLWMLTMLSSLFIGQAAATRAEEPSLPGREPAPPVSGSLRHDEFWRNAGRAPIEQWPRPDGANAAEAWVSPTPQQGPLASPGAQPGPSGWPLRPATAGVAPVAGPGPASALPADGTWRDDGRYVIVNVNGQEMRLLKTVSGAEQGNVAEQKAPTEGTVSGRLLNRGRPLVNCRVVLVPMKEPEGYDHARQPLSITTDDQGRYDFDHVAAGAYKLSWLPVGETCWIRRIAMTPDIFVHPGENVTAKEIRMARQTIN
jgi:hypothetical protein